MNIPKIKLTENTINNTPNIRIDNILTTQRSTLSQMMSTESNFNKDQLKNIKQLITEE